MCQNDKGGGAQMHSPPFAIQVLLDVLALVLYSLFIVCARVRLCVRVCMCL